MPLADRLKRMWRSIWVGSLEALLGVAVVGLLSLVFLGALQMMFPKGTGLVDLYGGLVGGERLAGASPGFVDGLEPPIVAQLSRVQRQVKDRPANAVVWNAAEQGLAVEHQHAIQTLARSGATIAIAGRGAIEMGENSLIVFRQPERDRQGKRRQASIALLGGEIRGAMSGAAGAAAAVDIVTANASTQFSADGQQPAEYSVSVGPDNSSTIKLFSGDAEIDVGDRRTVLRPDEALIVQPDRTISGPFQMAPAPRPVTPAADQTVEYGSVAPRVPFRWSAVDGVESYRLVIATDEGLEAVIYDAAHPATGFDHGALEHGIYYWQVSAIRAGLEGRPSPVRMLELARDVEPPALEVELVPQSTGPLTVRGTTEPGADVYIGEIALAASAAGAFEYRLPLRPGVNMIVVEAVDAVGNSSYYSEYVDAHGRPRRSP